MKKSIRLRAFFLALYLFGALFVGLKGFVDTKSTSSAPLNIAETSFQGQGGQSSFKTFNLAQAEYE